MNEEVKITYQKMVNDDTALPPKQLLNVKGEDGDTLMNLAVRNQNISIVKRLADAEADPFIRNENGMNAMMLASVNTDVDILEYLICRYYSRISDDDRGELLACAAANNCVENVKCMLAHEFSPVSLYRDEPTAVWAMQSENMELIRLLISAGASVNSENEMGQTLLLTAAADGQLEICRQLIEMGALIEKSDDHKNTPLLMACSYGRGEVVQLLLSHGADADVRCSEGSTALQRAIGYGHTEIVKLLLENGADALAQDDKGRGVREYTSDIMDYAVKAEMENTLSDY